MRLSTCIFVVVLGVIANVCSFSVRPAPDGRIIGGQTAQHGQFPFQAGLQIKIANQERLGTCGGSLIAEDYVLTAAHCVMITDIEYIDVHLGAHELRNPEEDHLIVTVPKENFIAHEEYNPNTIANDIALLKLPAKVQLSDTIQTVALPSYSDAKINMEDRPVVASGWGRYSDESQDIAESLQYAELRVLSQTICKHFYWSVLPSNICTNTGRGRGTCHGDSGGPLTYTDANGRTIIMGLTSFGSIIACVEAGYPSVFTRVTTFLEWIAANSDIVIAS